MSETRRHGSNPAGPLPAEFDRHLVELDQKLADEAGSRPIPTGLVDRTFRASVSLLPAESAPRPLRIPQRSRTPVWGQLAMAASVAAAFMVAAWFHTSAVFTPDAGDPGYAHHSPPSVVDTVEEMDRAPALPGFRSVERTELVSPEVLRLLFDGGSDYLIDTRDMTHADAIDDLHRLYEDLSEL